MAYRYFCIITAPWQCVSLILVLQVRMLFIINIVVLPTIGHIHGSVTEVKISHGIGCIRYNSK
jgi:hypothetical protein